MLFGSGLHRTRQHMNELRPMAEPVAGAGVNEPFDSRLGDGLAVEAFAEVEEVAELAAGLANLRDMLGGAASVQPAGLGSDARRAVGAFVIDDARCELERPGPGGELTIDAAATLHLGTATLVERDAALGVASTLLDRAIDDFPAVARVGEPAASRSAASRSAASRSAASRSAASRSAASRVWVVGAAVAHRSAVTRRTVAAIRRRVFGPLSASFNVPRA